MKRNSVPPITAVMLTILMAAGCATAPEVKKGSFQFLQKGSISPRLRGSEFYMGIGEVDLYSQSLLGGLEPTGKTVEIAVAIQADQDSGEALRIATLQRKGIYGEDYDASGSNDVTLADGKSFALADLRGGISLIDIQSYPHWLDAIDAMKDAIGRLSTYTHFYSSRYGPAPSVVAIRIEPGIEWGWSWYWPRHFYGPWRDHFHGRR